MLKRLSELVKEISIIMSTSCSSESAFSIGGYLERKARASLGSKTLRYTILTKEEDKIKRIMKLYDLVFLNNH
jgi:hypothetical protein